MADPHLRSATFFREVAYPGIEDPVPIAEAPAGLSGGGIAVRGRAPLLGEHTDRILAGLGFDPDDIADLRRRGVV
jgi:crotonobetainyl-CoA:carnitine CoA-transferase CaiB-like acyl-CoA transferase